MDHEPFNIGDYRVEWRQVAYLSEFLGGRFLYIGKWVVTYHGAFVGTVDSPEQARRLVRFVSKEAA